MTMKTEFIDYVHDFYGADSQLYPMGATKKQIRAALKILYARGDVVIFDSIDREKVRDILIEQFGLIFPPSPVT